MTFSSTPYGIRSGKIVYHFNMLMQEGTKTVIFDDSGRYVKVIVEAHLTVDIRKAYNEVDSMLQKVLRPTTRQLLIRTPDMQYVEDLDSLQGYRMGPGYTANPESFFGPNLQVVGKDTVLGRPCVIKEINGGIRVWFWMGIDLKTENKVEGMDPKMQVVAISIDEHYPIKPDEFEIPKNAKVISQ